ncbi:hypothetical protein A7U60_g5367 [Sanghuangporus baumii]|uniref:Manganese/iron superoxide dismutase C-terminal domain-containing protein n=1 Tax=Sanghuangporus baumii TaxID=108892 RepID=A0A9Q5HWU0_SANBA|nr:hypothetical protein A7U60_g5367 [Sanghuangporus baumii]
MHVEHKRRELRYPIENGVGNFLPPDALKTVVEWQDGLLERLNEQTRGTELALPSVLQIISESAGNEEYIRAHNYACLAANNSFFLDSLVGFSSAFKFNCFLCADRRPAIKKPTTKESNEPEMSDQLKGVLNSQFPGIKSLKERFVASASGMVSSGWLWLVTDLQGGLAVVPTFGAGTLLVRSRQHWKHVEQETVARQSFLSAPFKDLPSSPGVFPKAQDGPSPSSPVSGIKATPHKLNPNTPARSMAYSAYGATDNDNPSVRDFGFSMSGENDRRMAHQRGSRLYPLLALSLFEHTWLSAGLGVWGKEEYVRRFFDVVDWKRVGEIYSKFASNENLKGSITV